jgi:endonuclease G, mitochondrial
MAFTGYLTGQQIDELTTAAVDGDLLDGERKLLLAGLPKGFVLGLDTVNNRHAQFRLDVVNLNRVERMADGTVPLLVLLRNAAAELRQLDRAEAATFERMLARVADVAVARPALPDAAQLPEVTEHERIIGTDDTVDVGFLAAGLRVARSVAKISVPRYHQGQQVTLAGGLPWIASGTAWLIAPGLAITNHHVINARVKGEADADPADLERQAAGARLQFDFDDEKSDGVPVAAQRLVAWSKKLDYALLAVDAAGGRPIPRISPSPVVVDPTSRIAVNIVQHPGGRPKRVAFRNNLVTAADATTVRYFTDTDQGSSGSPVCDDRWRVVALHRGSTYASEVDYQGKDTAYVNYGIQIQAILADLRATSAAAAAAIAEGQ